jgi:hypothetical protein
MEDLHLLRNTSMAKPAVNADAPPQGMMVVECDIGSPAAQDSLLPFNVVCFLDSRVAALSLQLDCPIGSPLGLVDLTELTDAGRRAILEQEGGNAYLPVWEDLSFSLQSIFNEIRRAAEMVPDRATFLDAPMGSLPTDVELCVSSEFAALAVSQNVDLPQNPTICVESSPLPASCSVPALSFNKSRMDSLLSGVTSEECRWDACCQALNIHMEVRGGARGIPAEGPTATWRVEPPLAASALAAVCRGLSAATIAGGESMRGDEASISLTLMPLPPSASLAGLGSATKRSSRVATRGDVRSDGKGGVLSLPVPLSLMASQLLLRAFEHLDAMPTRLVYRGKTVPRDTILRSLQLRPGDVLMYEAGRGEKGEEIPFEEAHTTGERGFKGSRLIS